MTWPLALLLLGSTAKASAHEEPQAFDVRAVRCGEVLTRSTRLTRDLVCPGTPVPALTLAAPGVVLDLGGHAVRHSGTGTDDSEGIAAEAAGTVVRNGTIRGFNTGFRYDKDALLHGVALVDNWTAIYHRQGNSRLVITDSRLSGSQFGIRSEFDAAKGTIEVKGSLFTWNELVMLVDDHEVTVSGSTFMSNTNVLDCYHGRVRFQSSTLAWNRSVANLTWDSTGFDNCYELVFDNCIIANNTAFGTPEHPDWQLAAFQMHDSWVMNNSEGLRIFTRTVDFQGNLWWANAGGLALADLPDFVPTPLVGKVRDNRFVSNGGDGLRVIPSSTPTVASNLSQGNTGWGIHAPTAVDGGGSVARGNGAGGCVGVVCAQ
ncbi:right-handed parallel beta-helix repeat-containing protein [Corallococcus sp. EGB]|uniref:right-handed parallel beta-helix repeat-containing protein n=1 Tax=Corallococcus sp. EGB TaxID=1521117 RepID=UPI001CBD0D33|nr:right-handed parallel beta-helix repeat-containing protein [Corallococcus sp. EGB]